MKTLILALSSVVFFAFGEKFFEQPGPSVQYSSTAPKDTCIDAAAFLIEKFKKYPVIAIDEGPHSTVQTHEFLRSLFANRKFTETVNYVILEFINKDHQAVVDKYINGSSTVSKDDVKVAWREGTQSHSENFEKPVYFKLLEAIRNANLMLPIEKKIRVLAGDPPISWSTIYGQAQYLGSLAQRDVLPAQLAIAYGIKDSKKVLLIYGGEHVKKKNAEATDATKYTIPQYISQKYPNSVYTIGAYKGNGYPANNKTCMVNSIIEPELVKDENFDSYYFAGLSKEWKLDTLVDKIESPYWEELNRRADIVWGQPLDSNLKDKKKPGPPSRPGQ